MLNKFTITLSLLPLVGIASAANSVTYNFNSSTAGDQFSGNGVSGWSQDIANPSAFGQTFPLAYVTATDFGGGSSNAAHLGTQSANTPDNADTILTGSLSSLDAGGNQNVYNMVSVSFDLAVLDNSADSFGGRDGFSVALTTDSGAQAATVGFSPTTGNDDTWDVSVGVNGSTSTTGQTINANAGYRFYINSRDNMTDFLFQPADGNGIQIGLASLDDILVTDLNSISGIAFAHDPLADAGTSANALAFDNIEVTVPEPSSSLLLVISAGLIAIRRRR